MWKPSMGIVITMGAIAGPVRGGHKVGFAMEGTFLGHTFVYGVSGTLHRGWSFWVRPESTLFRAMASIINRICDGIRRSRTCNRRGAA